MRGLLIFLLLVVAWCVPQDAQASAHSTRAEAYAHCISEAQRAIKPRETGYGYNENPQCVYNTTVTPPDYRSRCRNMNFDGTLRAETASCQFGYSTPPNLDVVHTWTQECPAGQMWNGATNSCSSQCPLGGEWDPVTQSCQSQECKGKTPLQGVVHTKSTMCLDGCAFKRGALNTRDVKINNSNTIFSGETWTPTGAVCDKAQEPPHKPEECIPAQGMTMCVKPDGSHCVNLASGRQSCFKPGETGQRTDGNQLVTNDPGSQPQPRPAQLPSGDTLVQQAGPIPVTNTSSTTNTTTNVNVYNTTNGTNAGPTNQGTPTGGTVSSGPPGGAPAPGTGGNDGDGDGEQGTASGGGDCGSPPVFSGGDPALAMIGQQAWQTRCAVENENGVTETGNIADCSTAWSATAKHPNAADRVSELRALRATMCPGQSPDSDFMGDGSGEGSADDVMRNADPGDTSLFDTAGLGWGNTCPAIPSATVFGKTIEFDTQGIFCDFVSIGGWFVLLLAGFRCLRLVMAA